MIASLYQRTSLFSGKQHLPGIISIGARRRSAKRKSIRSDNSWNSYCSHNATSIIPNRSVASVDQPLSTLLTDSTPYIGASFDKALRLNHLVSVTFGKRLAFSMSSGTEIAAVRAWPWNLSDEDADGRSLFRAKRLGSAQAQEPQRRASGKEEITMR